MRKPLHPTLLAVAVRDICNNWPSYQYLKSWDVPAHCANIDYNQGQSLKDVQLKQQYLNSLN